MSTLPFTLPDCGQPAAVRIEVYSPVGDELHGSLDASVYACEHHGIEVASAIWVARLTAHKATMAPDTVRQCGEAYVFPTGSFGGRR